MNDAVLSVAHLTKRFEGLTAVNDVTFAVSAQRVTSLIGPNGAGKTTIFNLLSGFLPPTGGDMWYRGRSLTGMAAVARARLGLGRTFQEPRVFQRMTVLDNVLLGFPRQRGERLFFAILGAGATRTEEARCRARARDLLEFVGLQDRADDPAAALSFGQQRFLSLARVLAMEPEVLLMDEPTVGLDPEEIARLEGLLSRMVRDDGRTILLIEHNMDVVMGLSDWIVLLVEGEAVADGPPEEMKKHPRLLEAYLGVVPEGAIGAEPTGGIGRSSG